MPATPNQEVVRDRRWRYAFGAVLLSLVFAFAGALAELARLWVTRADYSHGFLVVAFAGYLLWRRRSLFPTTIRRWPSRQGLPFFATGLAMFIIADRVNMAREWLQAAALVMCLAGSVYMFCDRGRGLLWAWPSLLFLILAFPLPHRVEQGVSLKLRDVATQGATFTFQTLGIPAYSEGNRITLGETTLNVAEPCSGLSMLLMFVALAAAIALLYESRPLIDRIIVFLTAVPIAILCNVIRVVLTGLVYYAGWVKLGDLLFHDLFGWMMAPMALGFTWLVLKAMDWVIEPVERVSAMQALGLGKQRPAAPPGPTT